ncbi:thrombospondin-3 isoform X2 [Paramuricea clavata]|uniref:Thrombospondin-3 isoform X2 n=1 Tax=Paramuricea clavata TaxID=317549 RepID=A0A7D9HPY6_PARCT|nr:thrombospondin-3 isoform X2 [Paramuricea clavata]
MLLFAVTVSVWLTIFTCQGYEISLLTTLLEDPGKYNVELDSGINHRSDAFKFTSHVKKLSCPFEMSSQIITHMDAHDSVILVVNLKMDPYNYGSVFSASGNTKEVLLDVWVKSGVNPAVGLRYSPINSSKIETLSFGPVSDFRLKRWNKVVLHIFRIGVFQSVVDAYVNCEKIGRKITRSVLDLFAYKKKFKPNKVEFRIAQRGYGRNVHSRYLGSMQDLRLVFKRDIDTFVDKDLCKFPFEEKNEFIRTYHRALAEPIRADYGAEPAMTELMSMIKDLRYDLTIQTAEMKYVRELVEGCELCRVTDFCSMRPCYPGVQCFNAPKSKDGFYCGNCPFGSHGDGIHCSDIDECDYHPCSVLSTCINKSPGYTCEACPSGYSGLVPSGIGIKHAARTKQVCADVNECEIDNGGCDKLVECKNTPGSFKCEPCPAGYDGDPKIECRFQQYCNSQNPKSNPCNKYARCVPLNDGKDYRCECYIGFAGDGLICGYDKDADGYPDENLDCKDKYCVKDNCPSQPNPDQKDRDGDDVGDMCDNDIDNDRIFNKERDTDGDFLGNPCDTNVDKTRWRGRHCDVCDEDDDNDSIFDALDNCPLVANKNQNDTDGSGIGDVCKGDWDGDGVPDKYDASKSNNKITFTDFRKLQNIQLDTSKGVEADPVWIVKKKGTEVKQTANSDPGIAVGNDRFGGVDFNGTMYVDAKYDDDFIGFVFSYQDSSSFYAVTWKKTEQVYWIENPFRAVGISGLQLKKVQSFSGPGHRLRNALWHSRSTPNEIELLWSDIRQAGWEAHVRYHWQLMHRPQHGLIRLKFYKGRREFADTGYIHDNTFAGGRMGLYVFSQAQVVWTDLSYRANDELPEDYDNTINIS